MRRVYIPTISELQAFLACAQTGATTRAAQGLNLTQSAVSRSIGSMEKRLGVSLFNRVRQRLVLSDAGRAMQRDAERLLKDLERSTMSVMAFGGHTNVLRLAILPTLASSWLIPKLGEFKRVVPRMTFDIGARLKAVDFETEPFDAAIQRGQVNLEGVKSVKLMDEYLVAVASTDLVGQSPELEDYEVTKLALLQQSTRPRLWLDWFAEGGVDTRTILRGARFDHFDMVIEAAIAGLGVALVPEILAERSIKQGRLVRICRRRMITNEPYRLIYPARSEEIAGFARFKNWLIGAMA